MHLEKTYIVFLYNKKFKIKSLQIIVIIFNVIFLLYYRFLAFNCFL
jgi:hypothetical protein